MNPLTFHVQGSAEEPYIVTFSRNGKNISARCSCPGGGPSTQCKHRVRILHGSTEGIVSGNESSVNEVASWLAGSDVEKALISLAEAEAAFEKAKATVSHCKKHLAKCLSD